MTDKVKKFFSSRAKPKKNTFGAADFSCLGQNSSSLNRWLNKTWKDKFDRGKSSEQIGSTLSLEAEIIGRCLCLGVSLHTWLNVKRDNASARMTTRLRAGATSQM